MRLKAFRIMNYKCIDDSGEVPVGDYTVLVGKNESGKTSSLKALHKFNPAKPMSYVGLREFPRKRFHEFKGDEPVTTLTFELNQEEIDYLKNIDSQYDAIREVKITKDYAGKFSFEFIPTGHPVLTIESLSPQMSELKKSMESLGDLAGTPNPEEIKESLSKAIESIGNGIDKSDDLRQGDAKERITTQIQVVLSIAKDESTKKAIQPILSIANGMAELVKTDPFDLASDYLLKSIPTFVYFESYGIIDSRIHLPSFVERMKSGALSPDEKTAQTLFSMVNLDPELVCKLGKTEGKANEKIRQDLDERAIRVSRASVSMTGDLVKIWEQRENRVDFDADGDYLRLWVTDNIDGSRIELEERSKGFQWFLSFYIVFSVESERGHKDAILLLDDPGLYLHAAAQNDLIKVLRKLSGRNRLIYTTHSPFMIDMDALESVRTVTESKDEGTKISAEAWSTDKDALFPLQAALGYSMSQSLFVGQHNLIVEGITDFWYLSSLSNILREAGRGYLNDKIVISPAGGAQKTALLAAMLAGQKLKVGVLLDTDAEGKKVRDDIVKNRIIKDNRVIFIDEAVKNTNREMEFEDLFPESFYIDYVNKAYREELKDQPLISPLTNCSPRIRQRITEVFEQRGLVFHKTRPARLMLEDFGTIRLKELPKELVDNIERLFDIVNKRFGLAN